MGYLELIKQDYGENMVNLCRELFPALSETPDHLYTILSKNFNPSKHLYTDIISDKRVENAFIGIVMSSIIKKKEEDTIKTPEELLEEMGYMLYECKTEADIQKFRKYYKRSDGIVPEYIDGTFPLPHEGEELCTFDGDRLERCHVFFAVKDNADEIKREDYIGKERRQDPYGTSVISIQFTKGINNIPSIKNRYNHTVDNPDATFSNNLENINPGLTKAFEKKYGLVINNGKRIKDIPGYILANDGRHYKYNIESGNIYYCPDNIIIDNGIVKKYDTSRYLVIEKFIIDFQEKTITQYDNRSRIWIDTFTKSIPKIESIKVEEDETTKEKTITINGSIIIKITPTNEIKYYKNNLIAQVGKHFLIDSKKIEEIDLPHVLSIGERFLQENKTLRSINIPNCKSIESNFLASNQELEEIILPNVEYIGNHFMTTNKNLKKLSAPKCVRIEADFLPHNIKLEELHMPSLIKVHSFLYSNRALKKIELPSLIDTGDDFLSSNSVLEYIYLPNCKYIGNNFLRENEKLEEIDLPSVEIIEDNFLNRNIILKKISIPNCIEIGYGFLEENKDLERIDLPKNERIGDCFICSNKIMNHIYLPECKEIGKEFLAENEKLEKIKLPKIVNIGQSFLYRNKILNEIEISNCKSIMEYFLTNNECLRVLNINKANKILGKDNNKEEILKKELLPNNKIVLINGIINRREDNYDEKSESSGSKQI